MCSSKFRLPDNTETQASVLAFIAVGHPRVRAGRSCRYRSHKRSRPSQTPMFPWKHWGLAWSASVVRPVSATPARSYPMIPHGDQRQHAGLRLGVVGQPKLRGTHPPRCPYELPGHRRLLVVAYALAGTMDIDIVNDPLGTSSDGELLSTCATSWPQRG